MNKPYHRTSSGWSDERRAKHSAAIRTWAPWKNATGPRTDHGKSISRCNALKHAATSRPAKDFMRNFQAYRKLLAHCWQKRAELAAQLATGQAVPTSSRPCPSDLSHKPSSNTQTIPNPQNELLNRTPLLKPLRPPKTREALPTPTITYTPFPPTTPTRTPANSEINAATAEHAALCKIAPTIPNPQNELLNKPDESSRPYMFFSPAMPLFIPLASLPRPSRNTLCKQLAFSLTFPYIPHHDTSP